MRFSNSVKVLSSTFWCLFVFSLLLNGQTYSFKNIGAEKGIPNGFVYEINQADDGFLWVGTGNGLYRFDGFDFYSVQFPDSISSRYTTVSFKDKYGKLWFGCSDGSLYYTNGNNLISVPLSNAKSISDILEGPDGLIYIIPQGIAVFTVNPLKPEEIQKYTFPGDPVMFSGSFTYKGNLLVGTQENIKICRFDKGTLTVGGVIKGFDYSAVTSIQQTDDSTTFIIGTDGNGLFKLKISEKGNVLSRFSDHPEWNTLIIRSITEDTENNIWVSTFESGVIEMKLSDNYETAKSVRLYNINSGLNASDVKKVFQDIEGNYWFGFFGEGLSILTSNSLSYYAPGKNAEENNILFVQSLNGKYILGTPTGFHIYDPVSGKSVSYTNLSQQVGKTEISSFYLDNDKNLWIGTSGNGLYVRNNSGEVRQSYKNGDSGKDKINDIEIDNHNIWLATTNGVIALDRRSEKQKLFFDISNGLPFNSINKIFISKDGSAYVGTQGDRLYLIENDSVTSGNAGMSGSNINKILAFSQTRNGDIWAATKGNGVFEFRSKDSVSVITRANDLMNNYCYSILADTENNIWIGHDKGFSRYNTETQIMKTYGTDFANGGLCNPDAMYESADRKIFIGTTSGLIIYDRSKDRKITVPPFNNINSITINNTVYPYQPSFSLPYNKNFLVKVKYTGIHFSKPDKVFYSTYMENVDDEYSQMTTERERPFGLGPGKYRFNLISINEELLSQDKPVSFEISIKPPYWMRWWFILAVIAAISGIVLIIIRARDKSQKKIQVYLEKELDARTSVVMKQKGEIELQNIEITDSINYAKRIQSSILPDINKLKESFKDAFIFFHPRDIVSGDFYWFDKLGDDKFVLVCADSTGHGVPGAFMSMIGSTLLQDIVTRKRITKPSEILTLLDKQIFSTLNQNVELGVSNDGMDMVVCEFNIKTRHIRFASAMRPVIIVLDGEPYYIKGNRSSVGGESVIEKFFDDQEYYLNEGDTVYLFSDGLPDQFGGTDGKKMKIARLKRIIEQVSKLPMEEQKDALSKFFFDWKGNFDQVDDILLIGVKV